MTPYLILPLLALFINAVLAPLVIFSHVRERIHQVFALFLTSMALWGGTIFLMRASATLEDAFFWEKLVFVNFYLISVFFLHFTYIFSGVRPRRWMLPIAYGLTGVVILMSFSGLIAEGMQLKFYGYAPIGGPLLFLYLALSYGYIVLALGNIISVRRQPLSQAQRNRAGYLIIGAVFSLLGTVTDLLPLTGLPVYPLGIIGNILFVVVASIAILRYQLLDLNVVLRRGVGYLLVFTFLAGVSVLGSFILDKALGTTFLTLSIIGIGIALMILGYAILSPILSQVQPGVDRLFYRGRWASLRELQQFTTETKNISDPGSLAQSLVHLVERAMRSKVVVLVQPNAGPDAQWATASVGTDAEITLPFDSKSSWLQRMAKDDRPYLEREMLALPEWQYVPATLRRQMENLDVQVFIP
ncbi:MAG: histidine kinase N-terminal 7TM domain-containing protein, partial [Dehalococcoidia bacterium]